MDVFRKIVLLVTSLVLLSACNEGRIGSSQFSNTIDDEHCRSLSIENEYVIKYKDGRLKVVTADSREELIEKHIKPDMENIEVVDRNIQFFTPTVDFINPNNVASDNWGTEDIGAEEAWDQGYYGQGVTVAVIDSGVNIYHETLSDNIVVNSGETGVDLNGNDKRYNGIDDDGNGVADDVSGYNFASNRPDNVEDTGHGTHVAGVIANPHNSFNGYVVHGVAPKAKILPIDFIDGEAGSIQSAVSSIDYVIKMKDQFNIKVVNASWGGSFCSTILENKIDELMDVGILFVAASGNEGINIDYVKRFPAGYRSENIISVGSVSNFLGQSGFSNYGDDSVDIFAPGESIMSTVGSQYVEWMNGTSMAAPFVSGAAAALWSKKPSADYAEIKDAILNSGNYRPSYRNGTQSRLSLEYALEEI